MWAAIPAISMSMMKAEMIPASDALACALVMVFFLQT